MLCGYFALTKRGGGGGGSSMQIACCSPSSGFIPLLSYPLMPLPNLLAVIFHGMVFSPHFRLCSSSTREPVFSWNAVSECCGKYYDSCLCLRLCLGMSQRGSEWPVPSELSSRAVERLLGVQEGCCNVNCMETQWLSVPWKCFCRAACVC